MVTLAKEIEQLIEEQLHDGSAKSEDEALARIISTAQEQMLDRKVARGQEQYEQGQTSNFDDAFMERFLTRAKARHGIQN